MTTDPTPSPDETQEAYLEVGELAELLAELKELGEVVITHTLADLMAPARGTREYQEMLFELSLNEEPLELARAVKRLMAHYGWQAALDFLDLLVDQIALVGEGFKDSFGRIPLDALIHTTPDEADLLSVAISITNDAQLKEYELGFEEAMAEAERLAAENIPWRDLVQQALDAHTRGEPQAARPILSRLPGLRGSGHNPQRVANGVLMVCMAAMSARSPERLAQHLVSTKQPHDKARAAMRTLSNRLSVIHLR